MKTHFFSLVFCAAIILQVSSKNILYIAWPSYSHVYPMISIANELVKYGHKNYFILDKSLTKKFQNEENVIPVYMDELPEMEETRKRLRKQEHSKALNLMKNIFKMLPTMCDRLLLNETWIESLRGLNPSLVVVNGVFATNCLTIIPYKLSVPFVFTGSLILPSVHRVPWHPGVFPLDLIGMSDKMTFSEKIINTILTLIDYTLPPIGGPWGSIKSYAKDKPDITLLELLHQAQFFLIEKDVLLDYPTPLLPNMRYVGGLAAKPSSPLKGELLKFVEASTNGIVLVSFGSNIDDFPAAQLEKLEKAFKQIKYDVVWRQRKTSFSHRNVYTNNWIPQNDILGHPKTKLFITHCGNSGQNEALYHGVPMLGIPLFGDQFFNAKRMIDKKYGLSLDMDTFTTEELIETINELMENNTYSQRIKKASEILHSRPESPAQQSARHIDHIMKYGGEYLKSPCQQMPLYQFFMIDVYIPLIICVVLILYIQYLIGKKCLSICCRKKTKTD
ncbi:UDP-glucuronosyltransferase 2C1-like [Argonauta hians]